MKNYHLLFLIILPLIIGCEEFEEGEISVLQDTDRVYPTDILKNLWNSDLHYSSDFENGDNLEVMVVDDLLLIITLFNIYAYTVDDGKLIWTHERIPAVTHQQFKAKVIGSRLFILPIEHCSSQLLILNKTNGQLEDMFFLNYLSEVEGLCGAAFFHDHYIYFSTKIWNTDDGNPADYSYYIYKYNLLTENLELQYHNDQIFKHSRIIQPVINSEQTDIYFLYVTFDSLNHFVNIVEIPLDGSQQGERIISVELNTSSPILRYNSLLVKDNCLLGDFEHGHRSLRAFDLSDDGNILWRISNQNFVYSHQGEFYSIYRLSTWSLGQREIRTGNSIWFHKFSGQIESLNFIENRTLATSLSDNEKYLTIIDLNYGGLLVDIDLLTVGANEDEDSFHHQVMSYSNGRKIITITKNGRISSFKLPF